MVAGMVAGTVLRVSPRARGKTYILVKAYFTGTHACSNAAGCNNCNTHVYDVTGQTKNPGAALPTHLDNAATLVNVGGLLGTQAAMPLQSFDRGRCKNII